MSRLSDKYPARKRRGDNCPQEYRSSENHTAMACYLNLTEQMTLGTAMLPVTRGSKPNYGNGNKKKNYSAHARSLQKHTKEHTISKIMGITRAQINVEFRDYYKRKREGSIASTKQAKVGKIPLEALKFTVNHDIEPSPGQVIIIEILKRNKIEFYREVSFLKCRTRKGKIYPRFDFFLTKHNLIIEYDVRADGLKDKFCKKENVRLIRLNKEDYYNMEEVILSNIRTIRR